MRKATISFVMSVYLSACPSVRLHGTLSNFHEISYLSTFRKSVQRIQVSYNLTRITVTLHEDRYTFMIIARSVLRIRNASGKRCRKNQNTYFKFSNIFRNSCRLWDNMENMAQPDRLQMAIWRMRSTFWKTKATDTHWEYEIHCFSTATVVTRMRHKITLYVRWLSSCFLTATWRFDFCLFTKFQLPSTSVHS